MINTKLESVNDVLICLKKINSYNNFIKGIYL